MNLEAPSWSKARWWKYLSLVLLFYVLVGGLFVPLSPGLESVNASHIKVSDYTRLEVFGYNTHFFSAKNTNVFLRSNGKYFCVNDLIIKSDDKLSFDFTFIPDSTFTGKTFDLIVNNDVDGTLALREALSIIPADYNEDKPVTAQCEPVVKQNFHTGFAFPYREILYESIRNTFFHVPMWFSMLFVLIVALVYSIMYLNTGKLIYDVVASQAVIIALQCGFFGIITGMLWANYTWGSPWPNDPKLNGAAVGMLMYFAYLILRGAINDNVKRARISAVYNIFAIVIYVMFIFIVPRITDSLHPGNGGNPAFSKYDLDSHLRLFFYPAVIGWILFFSWILSLRIRLRVLEIKKEENEE